ncbi:MAG TPA: hypothetical protein VK743_17715 [Steroidobacteraceae bacterium]|jgi:hypothetical protein|nr:hypothetical protein [Steroidobacteraceae bacterium]
MRTKLTPATPAAALGRILDQLDRELIEASDEDILEAARDLGMNPMMKGSAAFIGLRVPAMAHVADFFDSEALKSVLGETTWHTAAAQLTSKRKARRLKPERSMERKDSADK